MIDIPATLKMIEGMDKKKVELEYKINQHKQKRIELMEELNKYGIKFEELDSYIKNLENEIEAKITEVETLRQNYAGEL